MKKQHFILIFIFIALISLLPIVLNPSIGDLIGSVTAILGPGFWVGVIVFVILIFVLIVIIRRWLLADLKPKFIEGGLPATATVIRSYQGGMMMRYGANHYYSIIIEANLTNRNGETWEIKMEETLPITQVGLFQPGVSFSVRYDPKDRSKVVFDAE